MSAESTIWDRSIETVSRVFLSVDATTATLIKQVVTSQYDLISGSYKNTALEEQSYETLAIVSPINAAAGLPASSIMHASELDRAGSDLIVDIDFRVLLSPLELQVSSVQIYPENEDILVIDHQRYKIKHLTIMRPALDPILFVAYVGKV